MNIDLHSLIDYWARLIAERYSVTLDTWGYDNTLYGMVHRQEQPIDNQLIDILYDVVEPTTNNIPESQSYTEFLSFTLDKTLSFNPYQNMSEHRKRIKIDSTQNALVDRDDSFREAMVYGHSRVDQCQSAITFPHQRLASDQSLVLYVTIDRKIHQQSLQLSGHIYIKFKQKTYLDSHQKSDVHLISIHKVFDTLKQLSIDNNPTVFNAMSHFQILDNRVYLPMQLTIEHYHNYTLKTIEKTTVQQQIETLIQRLKQDYKTHILNHSTLERFYYSAAPLAENYVNLDFFFANDKEKKTNDIAKLAPDNVNTGLTLINGIAGIGKTILMKSLLHQWAKDEVACDYDWVFQIPVRNLTESGYPAGIKTYTTADILIKECFIAFKCSYIDQLTALSWFNHTRLLDSLITQQWTTYLNQVSLANTRVLLILDDVDEQTIIPKHLSTLFSTLLNAKHLVITSHDYTLTTFYEKNQRTHQPLAHDRDVVVAGFNNDAITQYINNYLESYPQLLSCSKQHLIDRFSQFLAEQHHNHFKRIYSAPAALELLSDTWYRERLSIEHLNKTGLEKPNSRLYQLNARLYQRSFITLACNYLMRYHMMSPKRLCPATVYEGTYVLAGYMEHFAFYLTHQHQHTGLLATTTRYIAQQMKTADLTLFNISALKHFGLLKSNNSTAETATGVSYHFNHISFQQFFCARYLIACLQAANPSWHKNEGLVERFYQHNWDAKLAEMTIEAYIAKHYQNESYQAVFQFMEGILDDCNDSVTLQYFRSCVPAKSEHDLHIEQCQLQLDNNRQLIQSLCSDGYQFKLIRHGGCQLQIHYVSSQAGWRAMSHISTVLTELEAWIKLNSIDVDLSSDQKQPIVYIVAHDSANIDKIMAWLVAITDGLKNKPLLFQQKNMPFLFAWPKREEQDIQEIVNDCYLQ